MTVGNVCLDREGSLSPEEIFKSKVGPYIPVTYISMRNLLEHFN